MDEQALSGPHRANFDRVARLYRWAEYLCYGSLLQRVRTTWLEEFGDARQVFVLGDGDGRFLARLLERYPRPYVVAVDTSAAMLRLLRERCVACAPSTRFRLTTQQASALDLSPPEGTDLVVSHFFLDCLTAQELAKLSQTFAHRLAPGTRWLVSDFALPPSPILRVPARIYVRSLYAAFRMLTGLRVSRLPPIAATLRRAGFCLLMRREFAAGMLYSEVWQLGTTHDPASSRTENLTAEIMQTDLKNRPSPTDAQSNPEPPVPSLTEPDPGVFHHAPAVLPSPSSGPSAVSKKAGA